MARGDNFDMSGKKCEHFKVVMHALVKHYGTIDSATKAIGISDSSYSRLMRDDCLVLSVAQKILDGHSKIMGARAA